MSKKHAADWADDAPSPAQLKEFFAQIQSGTIKKQTLTNFLRQCDPKAAHAEYYMDEDFFHFLLNGLGEEIAVTVILRSGNSEWVYEFAVSCNELLSTEAKEILANAVISSDSKMNAYCLFRTLTSISKDLRKKLLEKSSLENDPVRIEEMVSRY